MDIWIQNNKTNKELVTFLSSFTGSLIITSSSVYQPDGINYVQDNTNLLQTNDISRIELAYCQTRR